MITVTGKMLAGSENKKTRDTLDGYLARLTRLSGDKNLPSRMRFLVKRGAPWQPRSSSSSSSRYNISGSDQQGSSA
jgi:hypothetical protein